MERLLHYVWKYRLFGATPLRTTDGLPVEVIDPGLPNGDAGPDFFNAKLRIGTTMWAGSVEIHEKASDWFAHHHETDRAYDSVILHVVSEDDVTVGRPDGELIPQMILKVPELLTREVDWLLSRDGPLPCASSLSLLDSVILLPIYPAREEPIPGVSSEMILDRITLQDKRIIEKQDLLAEISNKDSDILVTFGAGDIDRFVKPIESLLKEKYA